MVRALLDAKADVNSKGDVSKPIQAAFDNFAITCMLVDAGADVDAVTARAKSDEDKTEGTALTLAVRNNQLNIVEALLEAMPNEVTVCNALKASDGYLGRDIVAALLSYCPTRSFLGTSAVDDIMFRAIRADNITAVESLLDLNVDTNMVVVARGKMTALHLLCNPAYWRPNSMTVIKAFIRHGANLEVRNARGETALMCAVARGDRGLVRYFVRSGARTNTGCALDPLGMACQDGNMEIAKMLRASRADPAQVDGSWASTLLPLHRALLRRETNEEDEDSKATMVHWLVEQGAEIQNGTYYMASALFAACLGSTPKMMAYLMEHEEVEVDQVDEMGRTPLHAALYRTREHVKLILDKLPDERLLDAVDNMGRHALHCAVVSGQPDLVRLVLEKRPDLVNKVDRDGWTPLLWALRRNAAWGVEMTTASRVEILKLLLQRGARRLVSGMGVDRMWTPLKLVKYHGLGPEVEALVLPSEQELTADPGHSWEWLLRGGRVAKTEQTVYCWACWVVSP